MRFDEYEWNYLRNEITKISGGKYLGHLQDLNFEFKIMIWMNTEKYSKNVRKIFEKDYAMKRNFF